MASDNSSLLMKGVFISRPRSHTKPYVTALGALNPQEDMSVELDGDRADYIIQGKPVGELSSLKYNASLNLYTCLPLRESRADIDTQETFNRFDIEPEWAKRKHYWNGIFESRYETLMRDPKWPPLKVILVPRVEVNSIWKTTFERGHNDSVHRILSNVVKKLQYYPNLTFTWNEVSHLAQWWKTAAAKSRTAFRRLLKQGRLEIAAASWVETDEATSHIFGLVHQFIEGQQWLKQNLNYIPQVAWLTNSVTHSPTVAYLLAASGVDQLIFTNVHYSWEAYFAEFQYSDFVWVQNWATDNTSPSRLNTALKKIGKERFPKNSVLTHFLQFNSADFRACGPNHTICTNYFNFDRANYNGLFSYKVKSNAEILLEQYSMAGTISPHNTIIAPVGGANHFEKQAEFDSQYNYYQKLADYVNINRDVYKATVSFGTAKDYFFSIRKHKSYATIKGDFLNFADLANGSPAYWTGFFTSRPWFKILLRRAQAALRSAEIIFSFAMNLKVFQAFDTPELFEKLISAREFVARLQDRQVVSGTLSANTIKYIYKQITTTIKNCWYIQEVSASLLSIKPNKIIQDPYLQKYMYRDGELYSFFKTVAPGDQIYVFNSMSHERTEMIELTVRNPNIRIVDHNTHEVTIQINPVWKRNSDNFIRISKLFYKIVFAVVVTPLTLELYRIIETADNSLSVAAVFCSACAVERPPRDLRVFAVKPVQAGDVQIESYKYRLLFDERSGFLKKVKEKVSGKEKPVNIEYSAFRSSDVNSGMYLFSPNVSRPLRDVISDYRLGLKAKIVFIAAGQVTTELSVVYGRLLHTTVKIFNLLNSPLSNAIQVESTVDYEISPKNRDTEIFMSIQTNIDNGSPPRMFTDNNGFQYSARVFNLSRRIESNIYPMTTMSFIQDYKSRLTVITDHAQGVTAMQEGQIVIMLDRRVLFNDRRGTNEGLADSTATCHRNIILLENFIDISAATDTNLQLPSLSAVHLAHLLDYQLDMFVIDRSKADFCHYAFLPLVKTSFPCDVSLLNYRLNINKPLAVDQPVSKPNSALMILHRQSVFCHIDYDVQLHCNGDVSFSLDNIMTNVKSVIKTNLAGTSQGVAATKLTLANFPPMELATLKVNFKI
ncbi:alpha mannosidase middle domain-containing protein [Phthorimaea operculella]|nr:alpha mannosidase middle domain-containing protein [Phthorimaea operculella]